MIATSHRSLFALGTVLVAGALAGCTSTPRTATPVTLPPQPAPITPVETGNVQSSDLPPISGSSQTVQPSASTRTSMPNNTSGVDIATDDGFVSFDDMSGPGNTSSGRNLSGPLDMQQLIGGWTVVAGASECRLNLTYTAKGATGRYRASTPGCSVAALADVTSWQLLGNQIQLYNEEGAIVGTLLQSGDRFVGTLEGGQGISMVG